MILGQRADIHAVGAPLVFDVRFAAVGIIRVGMRVPSKPQLHCPGMRGKIPLERLRIGSAVDPVEIRSTLRGTLVPAAMIMGLPVALLVLPHPLPGPRRYGGIFEDIMVDGNNERLRIRFDHLLPPREGFAADDTPGIPPKRATPNGLGRLVAIAHHQEQEIPDPKGIALPGAVNWIGALRGMDAGELRVLPQRGHEFFSEAERQPSAAAESRSEAEAVRRRLQALDTY